MPPSPDPRIATALQPFLDRHELAGAVAVVADREQVLSVTPAGLADIEAQRAMGGDTLFWIASMTKPMTAAAVMMLVDGGRLALDDPVAKHLPEFEGPWLVAERDEEHTLLRRPGRAMTVRDLLRHTSGLPFRSPLEQPTLDGLLLNVAVGSYAMVPLEYEPGTRLVYSNAGINTAARILEIVTGEAYEDFLHARLLDPLGMGETTFWPSEPQAARLATVYRPADSGEGLEATVIGQFTYPVTDRERRYAMPAGGLFSTARDVARFGQMMLRGGELEGRRYLSEAAVAEMTARQTPPELAEDAGLGWFRSGEAFFHGGALATHLHIDPRRERVFVWLVQHAGFPGEGAKAREAFQYAALRGERAGP